MLFKHVFPYIALLSMNFSFGESSSCIPTRRILLSNCSFIYPYSNRMVHNRTLAMTVPYPLNSHEDQHLSLKILQHNQTKQALIHFNLNMIQCSNQPTLNWTSVESSSTLHGEFVRTIFSDTNIMYLSAGMIYLRNLTSIDCRTKTMYRTNDRELFSMNLKIESTLKDFCSNEHLCYPTNIYRCNLIEHQCQCQSPLQSYLTKDRHWICIHAVEDFRQCTMDNVRCLKWCKETNSSNECICPETISRQRLSRNQQTYCEGKLNGICNSFIQCPFGSECENGFCRNRSDQSIDVISLDLMNIFIITFSTLLLIIVLVLTICLCLLRQQSKRKEKKKKISHPKSALPISSDYDNIVYGIFRESTNDTSTFHADDSTIYQPKIVFLGGEDRLTAIYA